MRFTVTLLVVMLSFCLAPAFAEKPHGFGGGFVFGDLGDSVDGVLDDSASLSTDVAGYELYGKFGGKWGLYVSYRKMWSDDMIRDHEELSSVVQTDTECCMRAEYFFKALDFSFYRTWFPEKMWRPHAKVGWTFGDYDLKYWDLYQEARENPEDEFIAIDSDTLTPRSKGDSLDFNSPHLGLGFEFGSQRYAFFLDTKFYKLDYIQADFREVLNDSFGDDDGMCGVGEFCETYLEEDSSTEMEVTFGFIFKFGFE